MHFLSIANSFVRNISSLTYLNSNFEHVATGLIPEIALCITIKRIQRYKFIYIRTMLLNKFFY